MLINPKPLFAALRTAKGKKKHALRNQIATEALADPEIRDIIAFTPGPRDPDDRTSVANEVLTKAIDGYDLSRHDKFAVYFRRALTNAFVDEMRTEQRRVVIETSVEDTELPAPRPTESFQEMTEGLALQDRSLLRLRFVEGLTWAQTAERLGCSIPQARRRMRVCLREIKNRET